MLCKIGEVAKMYRLSVGTLRHYEALGLLSPEYVDPESGYRYYGNEQFEKLNTITYLRALDLPLSKIAEFLNNRDVEVMEKLLEEQKKEVLKKRRELEIAEIKIDNRLRQIKDAVTSELGVIKRHIAPKMRLCRIEEAISPKSYLDMEGAIRRLEENTGGATAFLGKVGVGLSAEKFISGKFDEYDCVFLILDDVESSDGNVTVIDESPCVSLRFRGSHTEAKREYEKLAEYMKRNGISAVGFSREVTMIDYGFTSDVEKFVTEITVPIKEVRNF